MGSEPEPVVSCSVELTQRLAARRRTIREQISRESKDHMANVKNSRRLERVAPMAGRLSSMSRANMPVLCEHVHTRGRSGVFRNWCRQATPGGLLCRSSANDMSRVVVARPLQTPAPEPMFDVALVFTTSEDAVAEELAAARTPESLAPKLICALDDVSTFANSDSDAAAGSDVEITDSEEKLHNQAAGIDAQATEIATKATKIKDLEGLLDQHFEVLGAESHFQRLRCAPEPCGKPWREGDFEFLMLFPLLCLQAICAV